MAKAQPEFELQANICEWLRLQHPRILFLSDVRASLKLTIPQQVRSRRIQADDFACPDLIIFRPNEYWHAALFELKAECPFKKDGELKTNAHLERQWRDILRLRERGFWADMIWDFDQAKDAINEYLK